MYLLTHFIVIANLLKAGEAISSAIIAMWGLEVAAYGLAMLATTGGYEKHAILLKCDP